MMRPSQAKVNSRTMASTATRIAPPAISAKFACALPSRMNRPRPCSPRYAAMVAVETICRVELLHARDHQRQRARELDPQQDLTLREAHAAGGADGVRVGVLNARVRPGEDRRHRQAAPSTMTVGSTYTSFPVATGEMMRKSSTSSPSDGSARNAFANPATNASPLPVKPMTMPSGTAIAMAMSNATAEYRGDSRSVRGCRPNLSSSRGR